MTATSGQVVIDLPVPQVVRFWEVGEFEGWRWRAECRCGHKSGPYVTPEMANTMRDRHAAVCLWPKP